MIHVSAVRLFVAGGGENNVVLASEKGSHTRRGAIRAPRLCDGAENDHRYRTIEYVSAPPRVAADGSHLLGSRERPVCRARAG